MIMYLLCITSTQGYNLEELVFFVTCAFVVLLLLCNELNNRQSVSVNSRLNHRLYWILNAANTLSVVAWPSLMCPSCVSQATSSALTLPRRPWCRRTVCRFRPCLMLRPSSLWRRSSPSQKAALWRSPLTDVPSTSCSRWGGGSVQFSSVSPSHS